VLISHDLVVTRFVSKVTGNFLDSMSSSVERLGLVFENPSFMSVASGLTTVMHCGCIVFFSGACMLSSCFSVVDVLLGRGLVSARGIESARSLGKAGVVHGLTITGFVVLMSDSILSFGALSSRGLALQLLPKSRALLHQGNADSDSHSTALLPLVSLQCLMCGTESRARRGEV